MTPGEWNNYIEGKRVEETVALDMGQGQTRPVTIPPPVYPHTPPADIPAKRKYCTGCGKQFVGEYVIRADFALDSATYDGYARVCRKCNASKPILPNYGQRVWVMYNAKWVDLPFPKVRTIEPYKYVNLHTKHFDGDNVFLSDGQRYWRWKSEYAMTKETFDRIYGMRAQIV